MDPENNDRALAMFWGKYKNMGGDLYLRSLLPVEVTRFLRNVKLYDNKMGRMANTNENELRLMKLSIWFLKDREMNENVKRFRFIIKIFTFLSVSI